MASQWPESGSAGGGGSGGGGGGLVMGSSNGLGRAGSTGPRISPALLGSRSSEDGQGLLAELATKWRHYSTKFDVPGKTLMVARALVCAYFFNQIFTLLEIWYFYHQPFPWLHLAYLPTSLLMVVDFKTVICGSITALLAFFDSSRIVYSQLMVFYVHGQLYINELMVKKMALLGAVILVLAQRYQNEKTSTVTALAGPLLSKAKETMSTRKSVIMLLSRMLMATLFMYVGITEIQRQMNNTVTQHGHTHSRRPAGDGHDSLWSKVTEFALSLPFVFGFRTNFFARFLALVLIIEAFTSWSWWTSTLNIGYIIHAREHFTVNTGVAGGLLYLAHVGAGKYTVDELIKKRD